MFELGVWRFCPYMCSRATPASPSVVLFHTLFLVIRGCGRRCIGKLCGGLLLPFTPDTTHDGSFQSREECWGMQAKNEISAWPF